MHTTTISISTALALNLEVTMVLGGGSSAVDSKAPRPPRKYAPIMAHPLALGSLMLALAACGVWGPDSNGGSSATGETVTDGGTTADSSSHTVDPPCADGTWSGWAESDGVLQVRVDGDDATGDGSVESPFATVTAALDAVRSQEIVQVAMGPGTFAGPLQLKLGPTSAGRKLVVSGCSEAETIIEGDTGKRTAVVHVLGPSAVTLRRLTTRGRGMPLVVGAGAQAVVEDVLVSNGIAMGIGVLGKGTAATLRRVRVEDITGWKRNEPQGWGIPLRMPT